MLSVTTPFFFVFGKIIDEKNGEFMAIMGQKKASKNGDLGG